MVTEHMGLLLEVVIEKARRLREAGVLRVRLHDDGLSFDLAPAGALHVDDDEEEEEPEDTDDPDPFKDPATYGGVVPGLPRRPREEHR